MSKTSGKRLPDNVTYVEPLDSDVAEEGNKVLQVKIMTMRTIFISRLEFDSRLIHTPSEHKSYLKI